MVKNWVYAKIHTPKIKVYYSNWFSRIFIQDSEQTFRKKLEIKTFLFNFVTVNLNKKHFFSSLELLYLKNALFKLLSQLTSINSGSTV